MKTVQMVADELEEKLEKGKQLAKEFAEKNNNDKAYYPYLVGYYQTAMRDTIKDLRETH